MNELAHARLHRRAALMGIAGAMAGAPEALAQQPGELFGVFEVCIGLDAAKTAAEEGYWTRFGYARAETGSLAAPQAFAVYGVATGLTSVRLRHASGRDHGHVRLMVWDSPTGAGAGLAPLLSPGSRWATSATNCIALVANHAEAAMLRGGATDIAAPAFEAAADMAEAVAPWIDPLPGVRRIRVIEQTRRRIFEERFGAAETDGAEIAADSQFKSSQVIEAGLVIAGDDAAGFSFYARALGLKAEAPPRLVDYETLAAGERAVLGLAPGDAFWAQSFIAPAASRRGAARRAGRFSLRAAPVGRWPSVRAAFGDLGMCGFTYGAGDIDGVRGRVLSAGPRRLSTGLRNEFGEAAVTFEAADGAAWQIVRPS